MFNSNRHRSAIWLVVSVIAVAASVILLPTWGEDAYAEEIGGFEVSDGSGWIGDYADIGAAITEINNKGSNNFTITALCDQDIVGPFTVKAGKNITLTSPVGEQYKLTVISALRHFTVNGSLTLENIILDGNNAGGGIGVNAGGILTMNDGAVIQNCNSTNGGGVYSEGTFTMNGSSVITGCTATSPNFGIGGGGVYNASGASFTMNGGVISGNIATNGGYGGGVFIESGASFTMNGGSISGNTATGNGGGVSNGGGASFTMNGGVISGNTAITGYFGGNGGGVFNNYNALFTMSGGVISGNTAPIGGGVYNFMYGTFTMSGGVISGNTAPIGGGVYNFMYGTFTMSGGVISGNTAPMGGGVYNESSATFNFSGGEISGNTATGNGGGVYNSGTFTFENGEISGNTANLGGGIYSTGSLDITSGTISGNTAKGADAKGSGGGIYTTNFANVTVKDGVVFTGNTAPTLRGYDIPTGADLDNNKTADLDDYKKIGAVELDVLVSGYNAPAYNNYDINYPADVWAVNVSIVPNGSGTVTVTNTSSGVNNIIYGILTEDGYIYVPTSVSTINISATPADGSVFAKLTANGVQKTTTPYNNVTVVNGMLVNAEFKDLVFTITVAADDTSTISPGDDVTVSAREDTKFTFSADPGYEVTAVYVDGEAISPEELAAGEYTFTKVIGDHTISVVSEAVAETGSDDDDTGTGDDAGTGPSDGTGAGGSDGTGTGSGGDSTDTGSGPTHGSGTGTGNNAPGVGSGSTGSGNENSSAGNSGDNAGAGGNDGSEVDTSPRVTNDGEWSVLSMIFAVIAVFAGVIALIAGRDRFRTDNEERRSKTGITLRVLALIIGIVSVIVLFVTEYGSAAPVVVGTWTPLMFVLLFVTLILAMVSFKFDKTDGRADK